MVAGQSMSRLSTWDVLPPRHLNGKFVCLFVLLAIRIKLCAGLDIVLRCLLCRDEVPSSEWILFNHQLGLLARVSLAFFFVAVPVMFAIWAYYGLCWVRHRPPVPIVSWWGPLQWVNPLQPSIRSAGQSFISLLCCCSSSGCNIGLLWFPSLSWWFILFSLMTSLMNGTLDRHVWSD
jgi:hypothetical protein